MNWFLCDRNSVMKELMPLTTTTLWTSYNLKIDQFAIQSNNPEHKPRSRSSRRGCLNWIFISIKHRRANVFEGPRKMNNRKQPFADFFQNRSILKNFAILRNLKKKAFLIHQLSWLVLNRLDNKLQSFTGYLRLTLVFLWNSVLRKGLIFVFQEFFANINKIFNLEGRQGTRLLFHGV